MKIEYRALEGTNTKTRRLAYLTTITAALHDNSLREPYLLTRIMQWSQEHKTDLKNYWVQTGEITSARSGGIRYLDLAMKVNLVSSIAGAYRASRIGLVLSTLVTHYGRRGNPFFLSTSEALFYTYWILTKDSDILLTILKRIATEKDISLTQLQRYFQSDYLNRLEQKQAVCRDESVRKWLRERRISIINDWKNPERYAEHLVPPRLEWLLDLDLLEIGKFRRHQYAITAFGQRLISQIPHIDEFQDVTEEWLNTNYWQIASQLLLDDTDKPLQNWNQINITDQQNLLKGLLGDTFRVFQYTFIPKVSLTQALLYLTIRVIVDHKVIVSPTQLTNWLTSPQIIGENRYELRLSPRENESYLLMTRI